MKVKRYRIVKAKPGEVCARWGRDWYGNKPDLVFAWNEPADAHVMHHIMHAFEQYKMYGGPKTLRQILDEKGYDLTTLKFSIMKKEQTDAG